MIARFMPRMARIGRALLIGGLVAGMVAGLAGCAQPPVPTDVFYRLDVAEPAPVTAQPVFDGKAEVRPLSADGVLRQRAIAYVPEGSAGVEQYNYHLWAEPPADMVQRELADYLRATNLFPTVVTPEFRVRTAYEIQGRLARFEQVLSDGPPRFVAEMELAVNRKKGLDLMLMKTYRVEEPIPSPAVEDASTAARQALTEIFARFAADLRAAR